MHRQTGFTLIEVMVVVVIIAILSAIAVPQYTDYVTRSKITEALAGLSDVRVRMEQFFQDNRTYAGACVAGQNTGTDVLPNDTANFRFRCADSTQADVTPNQTTYSVAAIGVGSMAGFVYSVDQSNRRISAITSVPGWTGNGNCWVTKKDGSC